MKRIISLILSGVLLSAALMGCQKENEGRDLTVELPVEYEVFEGANIVKEGSGIIDFSISRDLVQIAGYSDVIVRGTVNKVTNTSFDNYAIAAVELIISDAYKGELQTGDKITILQKGSCIPLRQYMESFEDAERQFSYMTDEEIDKTFYCNIIDDEPAEVGDECIYFLIQNHEYDIYPEGSYQLTRAAASVLYFEEDGVTLRRYPYDWYVSDKDNIEYDRFAYSTVVMAIEKAESTSSVRPIVKYDDIVREYGGDFHNDKFNDICPIKYNDIITIFDTEILLYPTFVDQNKAITNLAAKMSDFLDVLAQERNLAPLSDDNWGEYNTAVNVHMDSPDYNPEEDYSKVKYLLGFFDIYENKACNDEIRQVLASYDNANERLQVRNTLPSGIPEKEQEDFVSAFILCDIRELLPYYITHEFDSIPEVQRLLGTYEPDMSGREIKEYLLNKIEKLT